MHHIPARPARSFKEACRAFYLFQLALQLDNGSYAVNPEGADKALLAYYQHDIANGLLTEAQAYEIVECLWFKLAELVKSAQLVLSMATRCSMLCCTVQALRTQ